MDNKGTCGSSCLSPSEIGQRYFTNNKGGSPMKLIDIAVARTIHTSADKVFDLWLDPHSVGSPWYGVERAILNPVVDGLFYFAVMHKGRLWAHYGRFLQLERPHRIDYTWMSEATKGVESKVSLTLTQRGDMTDVLLNHLGVPDDELGHSHEEGWIWILSTLAEQLAGKKA
jgi:uncharacterized protein YndB with AHSA1/START domain